MNWEEKLGILLLEGSLGTKRASRYTQSVYRKRGDYDKVRKNYKKLGLKDWIRGIGQPTTDSEGHIKDPGTRYKMKYLNTKLGKGQRLLRNDY